MSYKRQNFDDGIILSAKHLNAMETGIEQAHEAVASLSEEMAGQTSPESFGAKGDGVTDDAAAITQALASGKNVVFDGTKTYAVGSTITIPADSIVDFRGATIVPKGNHDVIRVKSGARIENLIVKCTDVSGWDSSVLVFYGGDMFSASSPTRVNNVKLYNNMNFNVGTKKTGNGLYLYVDGIGQCLEGLAITDVATIGFNHGVYIYSTLPNEEDSPDKVFIGANNFRGYWSYRDCYGIYMDAPLPNNWMTNNFFTDLNIQSDYYGGSVYGIYCNGYENFFSGCLYDYSILSYHPETAVYFDYGSQRNTVEVTAGVVHSQSYCIDKGGYNDVINIQHDDVFLPYSRDKIGMHGNQDDVLAFVDKFGTCTLESLDSEPIMGELSYVFDPTPWKRLAYRTSAENPDGARAIITINLPKVIDRFSHFVLQFGRSMPKIVKVTLYTATDTTVIYNREDNTKDTIIVTPLLSNIADVYDVVKIVVELGGVTIRNANDAYGEWAIERIMAVDSWNTGNTWLRRDGGKLCGNISFLQNTGPVLRDANGKTYLLTVSTEGVLGVMEYQEQEEETPEAAALVPVMMPGASWYNAEASGVEQSSITSVAFDAVYEPTGNEDASWACDDAGNGNIMAYRNGSAVVITPTTGSDKIQLNADSTHMFSNDGTNAKFSSLASITGTEMWVADRETNMNSACQGNTLITDPICIPEGVIYIQYTFNGCSALTKPPVLPEGLISMLSAFGNCVALQYLPEIPSTVTNMNYAFMTCKVATKAPSVIPAGMLKMTSAFRGCFSIDGTIEVNATNLSEYADCFLYVGTTSGAITLTGSCPLLAELAATNTQGKVTVATA